MPFVQGKCESCGGILAVDSSLKAANCPFCGAAYVVQDSINYYNTTIKIDTLHADVVNVSDESSSEGRLKAADAYMKLGKYSQAEEEYKKVTELTPQNYLGWLGLIESHTYNYTKRIRSASELQKLNDYSKSVEVFAHDGNSDEFLNKYTDYVKSETEKNSAEIEPFAISLKNKKDELEQLEKQEESLKQSIADSNREINSLRTIIVTKETKEKKWGISTFLIVAGAIPTCIGGVIWGLLFFFWDFNFGAFTVGLVFLLVGGLPFYLIFKNNFNIKSMNKQIKKLEAEQTTIEEEIKAIHRNKETTYLAMLSSKSEIEKYK